MRVISGVMMVLFLIGFMGCAATKPNLDERRQNHQNAIDAMETAVDEEEKKKKEQEGATPN